MVVEADSLYRALQSFDTHIVCRYPDGEGIPRPAMDDVLEVTVDGREGVLRATMRQAWDWANRKSDCKPTARP